MPTLQLENKTARILHISMGDGATITIPPTEGGIVVELSDAEKAAFDANVATEEVQEWITGGVLVITEKVPEPPPPDPPLREGEGVGTGDVGPGPDAPAPDLGEDTPKRGHKRGRHDEP
jgi:hypothetical protein